MSGRGNYPSRYYPEERYYTQNRSYNRDRPHSSNQAQSIPKQPESNAKINENTYASFFKFIEPMINNRFQGVTIDNDALELIAKRLYAELIEIFKQLVRNVKYRTNEFVDETTIEKSYDPNLPIMQLNLEQNMKASIYRSLFEYSDIVEGHLIQPTKDQPLANLNQEQLLNIKLKAIKSVLSQANSIPSNLIVKKTSLQALEKELNTTEKQLKDLKPQPPILNGPKPTKIVIDVQDIISLMRMNKNYSIYLQQILYGYYSDV